LFSGLKDSSIQYDLDELKTTAYYTDKEFETDSDSDASIKSHASSVMEFHQEKIFEENTNQPYDFIT